MEESLFSIILSFGYQRRSLILQYFTLDLEVWESSFLTLGEKKHTQKSKWSKAEENISV